MSPLVACPGCDRHVHEGVAACPFCGSDASASVPGNVRAISRRELTRAAAFTGAALLLGACSSADETEDDTVVTGGGGGGENTNDDDDTLLTDNEGDGELEEEEEIREGRGRGCPDPNDMSCLAMPYGAPPTPESFV